MGWREEFEAKRRETERWINQRNAEVRRGLDKAEARGRQAYADAIRTGKQVLARTPAEVRALGMAAATGQLPAGVAAVVVNRLAPKPQPKKSTSAGTPAARSGAQAKAVAQPRKKDASASPKNDMREQVRAGIDGFADEFTFGLADHAGAAWDAAWEGSKGEGFLKDYRDHMAIKQAQDAFDSKHHGAARNTGRVVGFVGSLAATGPVGAGARAIRGAGAVSRAIAAANRLDRIRPMTPGGMTAIAAVGGAAAGAAGQVVHDVATRHSSSLRDYLGAAGGGALAGLALRAPLPKDGRARQIVGGLMPRVAGGIEGGATEVLQSTLKGEDISALNALEAARAGVVGGRVGELVGKYGSNALSRDAKHRLGEDLSELKSFAAGEGLVRDGPPTPAVRRNFPRTRRKGAQHRIYLPSGKWTVADEVLDAGKGVEAKFGGGRSIRFTPNQTEAYRHFAPRGLYRGDHWLPMDIGRAGAVGLGGVTAPWGTEWDDYGS